MNILKNDSVNGMPEVGTLIVAYHKLGEECVTALREENFRAVYQKMFKRRAIFFYIKFDQLLDIDKNNSYGNIVEKILKTDLEIRHLIICYEEKMRKQFLSITKHILHKNHLQSLLPFNQIC